MERQGPDQAAPKIIRLERQIITMYEEPSDLNTRPLTSSEEMARKLRGPCMIIMLVIIVVFNTIMMLVGILTFDDCPIQPNIPLYLAVAGGVGIVSKTIQVITQNHQQVAGVNFLMCSLCTFEFIWMILGSIWIYRIYLPNFDPEQGLYCNKTAYLLAFWLITINYICIMLAILIPCCMIYCAGGSRTAAAQQSRV